MTTNRPLATDEVLLFDLPLRRHVVDGGARAARAGYGVYALRFERPSVARSLASIA